MEAFRIISLVPSLTELLVDLGLKDCLVGVTKFCIHPKGLKKAVPIVGGTKNLNLQLIKKLQPTHIIANKEENNKEDVTILSEFAHVHVSDINNINDIVDVLKVYDVLFSIGTKATLLQKQLVAVEVDFRKKFSKKKVISVAYFIWKNPWMSVGNDTFINYMLSLANFKNITAAHKRYPIVDIYDISTQVVLLSSEPYPFKEEHFNYFDTTQLPCFLVNGEYFSWYGSRILKAFKYFKKLRKEVEASL